MFDYKVNYELWFDDIKIDKEEIVMLEDFIDSDFFEDFITDKLKELHSDDSFNRIEIVKTEALIDRNIGVENFERRDVYEADNEWFE